jgi:hypothetical protein
MAVILWISLFALITFLIYLHRLSIHSFITHMWNDGTLLLSASLVTLAVTAIALNSQGVHPMSIPGMFFMGLVIVLVGAIFMRWGETRR